MGWQFPWSTSKALAGQRAWEEILKRGGGDKKVEFDVPMSWVNKFDVFTTFRLQDPYAISADGSGDIGRYYFIESISYDFAGERLKITAIDLQWLLELQAILGSEDELPGNWEDATEDEKLYFYLPRERDGRFQDGRDGKRIFGDRRGG